MNVLSGKNYIWLAVLAAAGIIVMRLFYQWDAVPFRFSEFLYFRGSLLEPLMFAWPVFLIGIVVNSLKLLTTTNPPEIHKDANKLPMTGFALSLMAGVLEEIVFRWVLPFGLMGLFWVVDSFILQGRLREVMIGEFSWFNRLITLGSTPIINEPANWSLGLAIFVSNWKFQKGHAYSGVVGQIMSWVAGLFLFAIMFRYGLYAAMFVHFSFDMLVFIMLMVDVALEKASGVDEATNRIYQWY